MITVSIRDKIIEVIGKVEAGVDHAAARNDVEAVCAALLSSAAAEAEMREIIAMYVDPCDVRSEHQAIVNAIQGNQ